MKFSKSFLISSLTIALSTIAGCEDECPIGQIRFVDYVQGSDMDEQSDLPSVSPLTVPCPNNYSVDASLRKYAQKPFLAEHPNPTCSRDWVCVPLQIWTGYPFCEWREILKGAESNAVWITLPALTDLIFDTDAREITSRGTVPQRLKTSTWKEYGVFSPADTVTDIEAVQPGVPGGVEGTFRRLSFTRERAFESTACPRKIPANSPYNAKCNPWLP